MSKFNLSSVYTNDNIYSVLKLLKALIDTLDNYEFQDPIVDANGNQIPMTWFQKLYKSINGADDGSVEVGKDAHVAGSLNVDLSALINGTISLAKNKLGLQSVEAEKMYFSNVTLKYKGNTEYPGIVILYSYQYVAFVVDASNGVLHFLSSPLSAITETNTGFEITAQPFGNIKINCSDLMSLPSRVNDLESGLATANDSILGKQDKLYRHTLNVKGASYFAVFDFYSISNNPIGSLQDLTTYLKPTATSVYPCTCFTNNATPAPANMNAIKYNSNAWKFCLTGGTTETFGDSVLSVSDSVTAVD